MGAGRAAGGARDAARRKLALPRPGRRSSSSSPARSPRDVADDFYANAIHELARRQSPSALDCDGEPLRYGVDAEPFLVVAEPAGGGVARRPGVPRRRGLPLALDADRRARRAERDHHHRGRLLALLREGPRGPPLPGGRAEGRAGVPGRGRRRAAGGVPGRPVGRPVARGRAAGRGRRRAPRRCSSSAPAASIRARRTVSRAVSSERACACRLTADRPRHHPARPVEFPDGRRESTGSSPSSPVPRSSRRRASPSTTCCSCPPSRRCCRTTSRRRRG